MRITCDKCNKETEGIVTRTVPHRAVCEHCGKQIDSITSFAIASLVRDKKFATEAKAAFSFFCERDRGSFPGELKKDAAGKYGVFCTKCGDKMNVTEFMILQLKESIQKKK